MSISPNIIELIEATETKQELKSLYKDQILPVAVIAERIETLDSDIEAINEEMTALVIEMNESIDSDLTFTKLIGAVRHKLGILEEGYLKLP